MLSAACRISCLRDTQGVRMLLISFGWRSGQVVLLAADNTRCLADCSHPLRRARQNLLFVSRRLSDQLHVACAVAPEALLFAPEMNRWFDQLVLL